LQIEVARQLDHVHHRISNVDVAGLEHARGDPHVRVRRGIGTVGGAKQPVVAAHERFGRWVDELDATHLRRCFRTLTDRHDRNRAVGSNHQ
jgi:hypothetical protein